MDAEQNKAVVRRYIEGLNRRNEAVIDDLVAEDFAAGSLLATDAGEPEMIGRDGVRAGYRRNIAAFPDYAVTIEDLIAEGDRVVLHWTHRGTHRGEFLGVPATGREIVGAAVSVYRIVDGRIAEVRAMFDRAEVWEQLGIIPDADAILAGASRTRR
jgi:steroid delta-isomerase-like uncharacterized protein